MKVRASQKKKGKNRHAESENYTLFRYCIDFSPSLACLIGVQGKEETSVEPMKVDPPCEAADVSNKDGMLF